jgi:limonene 1,2-monooxygenase
MLSHNWANWEATKRSYELMARYVHPYFQRQSNTLRVASYDNATAKHETAGAESAKAVLGEIERYEQAKGQPKGKAAGAKAW